MSAGLAGVLAEHEAVGWMADATGERGWTCLCGEHVGLPPEHAAHVAAAVLAWIETVAGDAAVRSDVAEELLNVGHQPPPPSYAEVAFMDVRHAADAAVAALLAAVRSA